MKVISTFSGIGGSSLGYKLAGFEVVAANEFVDFQAENYALNNPGTNLFTEDIRKLDPTALRIDLGLSEGELDVLDGSPPCSDFSLSGKREAGWGKEKKYSNTKQRVDDLFDEYIKWVDRLKPKVFVAENVAGLTRGTAVGYFNVILEELTALGYRVKAKVLNAANYGVPQSRERVFIIGVRNDLKKEPVFPEHKLFAKETTAYGATYNSPNTKEDYEEVDISRFAIYPELKKLSPGKKSEKYQNLVKADPFKPCPTITATAGNLGAASVCHWQNRKFTVPELKRIATFPDDFKLEGTYQQRAEGIGRSVPPLLMKAVAEQLKKEVLGG